MGDPRRLWIPGPAGRLEAALRRAETERGAAVVAHPHPLHGGTLDNPVVFHSDRALNRAGFTTLRFNFRGVGASEGKHDDGQGEVEDLGAAATWLRGVAPSVPLLLVGYSFGSVCAIQHALADPQVRGLIAIGLPVLRYPFEQLRRLEQGLAVIQGSDDEFGSPDEVREVLTRAGCKADVYEIEGASHLFPNQAHDAAARVVVAADSLLDPS